MAADPYKGMECSGFGLHGLGFRVLIRVPFCSRVWTSLKRLLIALTQLFHPRCPDFPCFCIPYPGFVTPLDPPAWVYTS